MLNIFTLSHGRLYQEEISALDALGHCQPIWGDLENPSERERHWVAQHFDLHIPENAVAENIEESARFFEEDNGELHIRADFLADVSDEVANEVLATIARQEHLNGMIRRSAMDTRRALSFMMRTKILSTQQVEEARQTARDLDSLESHTVFIFDKINFLMDATVGFININQNKIIKLFSVASVALLPPTLIASIYGMNFQHMPELAHEWGYPFALVLMVLSALLSMWYFRRKGWLK